jgi:hypothetical protein
MTDEYRVEVLGHMTVEAETREEAEEKAEELAHGMRGADVEHTGFTAHPLPSNEDRQDYYFSHIQEVGSSASSSGYGLMKDKSALNIAFRSSTAVCRSLVGREMASPLRYNLAAFLLSTIEGYEWDDIQDFVEEIKEKARDLPEDVDNKYSKIAGTEFVVEEREDEINEQYFLPGPDEEVAE